MKTIVKVMGLRQVVTPATAVASRRCTLGNSRASRLAGDQPWLLGAQRSLADAYFIGIARWTAYHAVLDRRDYPGLSRLSDRLEADPAVRFAHAIEAAQPATSAGGVLGHVSLDEAFARIAGAERSLSRRAGRSRRRSR